MASLGGWDYQMAQGPALSYQYKRDDDWLLSAAHSKSFADFAPLRPGTQGNASVLRPSLSQNQLASLPSLKIRSPERNPVTGLMPEEVNPTHINYALILHRCPERSLVRRTFSGRLLRHTIGPQRAIASMDL